MTLKLYLDTRRTSKDGLCRLKISLSRRRKTAYIDLGIDLLPSQWDGYRVVNHPHAKWLNDRVTRRRAEADLKLLELKTLPQWKELTAIEARDALEGRGADTGPRFAARYREFMNSKTKRGTRSVYSQSIHHFQNFDPDWESLSFSDIDVKWLTAFEKYLYGVVPKKNSRNIHLRNIRAVFNAAIDDGLTTCYPFRKFKIRPERTRHRALTPDQLRALFNWPVEDWQRIHLDIFRLMFLLMGINMVDLYNLESVTPDGRIEYTRAKTGRLYSIKAEPEALEIIDRYRGKKKLLCIADTYSDHRNYLHHLNACLKGIGCVTYGKRGRKETGEPVFPGISSYWARHSWATTAALLDIPKETIAAGLGHGGDSVTDIYIDFDRNKVDRANRKVIDYVLYEKL